MIRRPEIRKDYIQDKYVIIAPRRGKRPRLVRKPEQPRPSLKDSIFSPQNINSTQALYTVGPKNNWRIKVVPNKFPAVSVSNPKAYGRQEVIIETPNPRPELHQLSVKNIAELLKTYGLRADELVKDKKIQYILTFKNAGGGSGASLMHSHSQIFASDFIPPHLLDKSQKLQEYKIRTGRCIYCDIIKKEIKGPRKVYADKHVVAFTPYASMYNYECWIMPLRHHDNISVLDHEEYYAWAKILKHLLKKVDTLKLAYNYYLHRVINDNDQHVYMKIVPRGEIWGGVEIGSGVVINPIDPDEAAKYYRRGLNKRSSK
ncbi:MAG: DUF4931 domain-containing protein [Candidatus Komeilibacteria bacterium]